MCNHLFSLVLLCGLGVTLNNAELLHPWRLSRQQIAHPYVHQRAPPVLYTSPQQIHKPEPPVLYTPPTHGSSQHYGAQGGYNLPNGQPIQALYNQPAVHQPQQNYIPAPGFQPQYNQPVHQVPYQPAPYQNNYAPTTQQGSYTPQTHVAGSQPFDQAQQNKYAAPSGQPIQNNYAPSAPQNSYAPQSQTGGQPIDQSNQNKYAVPVVQPSQNSYAPPAQQNSYAPQIQQGGAYQPIDQQNQNKYAAPAQSGQQNFAPPSAFNQHVPNSNIPLPVDHANQNILTPSAVQGGFNQFPDQSSFNVPPQQNQNGNFPSEAQQNQFIPPGQNSIPQGNPNTITSELADSDKISTILIQTQGGSSPDIDLRVGQANRGGQPNQNQPTQSSEIQPVEGETSSQNESGLNKISLENNPSLQNQNEPLALNGDNSPTDGSTNNQIEPAVSNVADKRIDVIPSQGESAVAGGQNTDSTINQNEFGSSSIDSTFPSVSEIPNQFSSSSYSRPIDVPTPTQSELGGTSDENKPVESSSQGQNESAVQSENSPSESAISNESNIPAESLSQNEETNNPTEGSSSSQNQSVESNETNNLNENDRPVPN